MWTERNGDASDGALLDAYTPQSWARAAVRTTAPRALPSLVLPMHASALHYTTRAAYDSGRPRWRHSSLYATAAHSGVRTSGLHCTGVGWRRPDSSGRPLGPCALFGPILGCCWAAHGPLPFTLWPLSLSHVHKQMQITVPVPPKQETIIATKKKKIKLATVD